MSARDGKFQQAEERLTVTLAQTGDAQAFHRLVEMYDQRLYYFIRRIIGDADAAFDVLQAVWLQVHRKIRSLSSPGAFRVWIYRIAHNRAVSELRRMNRGPISVEQIETEVAETSDENESFDHAELVHRALQNLSIDHQRVLTLRFLEEMSVEEIADVIDGNPGTVKSRLHYAKKALRDRIKELLDE
ncbi:MAG TPA: sigma-70 family RNA polymerase sigma factor [Planctomycetaceae bacterium]|nr:sigma-70 family RNA polymerase sigma factor [Planctomycetaceae bacterium]